MITLELPPELEQRLNEAARESGESFSSIAQSAFLDWLEDFEDVRVAEARLADLKAGRSKTIPLAEVMRKYGLES